MCNTVGFGEGDVYISVLCVRCFSAKLTKHTWRKLLCTTHGVTNDIVNIIRDMEVQLRHDKPYGIADSLKDG